MYQQAMSNSISTNQSCIWTREKISEDGYRMKDKIKITKAEYDLIANSLQKKIDYAIQYKKGRLEKYEVVEN
jgi:hypothetical protein